MYRPSPMPCLASTTSYYSQNDVTLRRNLSFMEASDLDAFGSLRGNPTLA